VTWIWKKMGWGWRSMNLPAIREPLQGIRCQAQGGCQRREACGRRGDTSVLSLLRVERPAVAAEHALAGFLPHRRCRGQPPGHSTWERRWGWFGHGGFRRILRATLPGNPIYLPEVFKQTNYKAQ
jgi:hypothetical protein